MDVYRVNAICPGFIDSPWYDKLDFAGRTEAMRQHMRSVAPLQTTSSPEDVAKAALFLGSRAARTITGETLLIDAGLHLGTVSAARE